MQTSAFGRAVLVIFTLAWRSTVSGRTSWRAILQFAGVISKLFAFWSVIPATVPRSFEGKVLRRHQEWCRIVQENGGMFQCFHFLYGGVFSSHTAPAAPSRSPPPPFHRSPLAASSQIPRSAVSAESPSGGSRSGHPSSSPAMSGSVEKLPPHGPFTPSPDNHRRYSFNGRVRAARLGLFGHGMARTRMTEKTTPVPRVRYKGSLAVIWHLREPQTWLYQRMHCQRNTVEGG